MLPLPSTNHLANIVTSEGAALNLQIGTKQKAFVSWLYQVYKNRYDDMKYVKQVTGQLIVYTHLNIKTRKVPM